MAAARFTPVGFELEPVLEPVSDVAGGGEVGGELLSAAFVLRGVTVVAVVGLEGGVDEVGGELGVAFVVPGRFTVVAGVGLGVGFAGGAVVDVALTMLTLSSGVLAHSHS